MKCLALGILLLGLVACAENTDFPVGTQGGGPPAGQGAVPIVIVGHVCVVTDPRFLVSGCINTAATNLTVAVGTQVATITPNGSFVINAPTAITPTSTVTVSGVGVIPSTQLLAPQNQVLPSNVIVPVLREDLFARVLAANGIVLTPGSGTIVATVVRGGIPVSGVNVISTPSPAFGPFFDGTTPTAFTLNGTGAQGVALLPGFNVGTPVQLSFTDSGSTSETTVGGVQVIDGGITFVEGILP
jgi:hypothetical protein